MSVVELETCQMASMIFKQIVCLTVYNSKPRSLSLCEEHGKWCCRSKARLLRTSEDISIHAVFKKNWKTQSKKLTEMKADRNR